MSQPAIDWGFSWFWRHLLRLDAGFDSVISASDSLSQRLRAGGLSRVMTHPMGVEPGLFSPALRDEDLHSEMLALCALPPEATLLIGVGRHAPEKRWPMVIDACVAAGYDRPIGLVLIGAGRESPRVRRSIGGNPHVRLLSPVTDRRFLGRLMASADALVHGCESETFCLVAAEARASGLPLVVPDRGGAYDQLREGEGQSYRAGQAGEAADAIRRLVEGGIVPARQRALDHAQGVHTMDQHFEALFDHYEDMVAPMRRAA